MREPALVISTSAVVISISVLLFTVFSFWWMNWRKGKLHVGSPRSFATQGIMEGRLVLRVPFVFFNDGPIPIFVHNLRLIFLEERPSRELNFIATQKELAFIATQKDLAQSGRTFATQFPVRGREAVLRIYEFHREPGKIIFEARSYPMELQARLDNSKKWERLCSFSLNVSEKSLEKINEGFYAHDNMATG